MLDIAEKPPSRPRNQGCVSDRGPPAGGGRASRPVALIGGRLTATVMDLILPCGSVSMRDGIGVGNRSPPNWAKTHLPLA